MDFNYRLFHRGSCGELRTQLYITSEIGVITKDKSQEFIRISKEISAMLFSAGDPLDQFNQDTAGKILIHPVSRFSRRDLFEAVSLLLSSYPA